MFGLGTSYKFLPFQQVCEKNISWGKRWGWRILSERDITFWFGVVMFSWLDGLSWPHQPRIPPPTLGYPISIFSKGASSTLFSVTIDMQRQSFAQTGRSTLSKSKQAVEVPAAQLEKAALDAFKASTNLNKALFQERQPTRTNRVLADTAKQLLKEDRLIKDLQKHMPKPSEDTELQAEVAALNHYRAPAANENTKQLVDKIVTGRRAKHISNLQDFQADVEEYMSSVRDIYSAMRSEAAQFIKINDEDLSEYCRKLSDEFLMSKEKEILTEINQTIQDNADRRRNKMEALKSSLSSSESERTDRISGECQALKHRLIESAFVLEAEAQQISDEWKSKLTQSQATDIDTNKKFVQEVNSTQTQRFEEFKVQLQGKQLKWKELKQEHALQQFKDHVSKPEYCNSDDRKKLYVALKKHQEKIHEERKRLIEQLANADAGSYTKAVIEKWQEKVKLRNEESNAEIDRLVASLVQEGEQAKRKGEKRLDQLRNRLAYIELQAPEQNQKTISERAQPLLDSNIQLGKKLLSDATGYIEKYDSRENDVCENLAKFMLKLGQKNDENRKTADSTQQAYELSKAKAADEDEEKVDKLSQQLDLLKKELKESLHHIKLQEMEKKCFDKIDEIQQQYRSAYEQSKQLAAEHPKLIEKDMQKAEGDAAEVFRLYDEAKKAELVEKNKKEAEQKALKRIEIEQKRKVEEQARQAEQTKKKTGKAPPPPKPKDPKKAASQLEERKLAILKEMGPVEIKEFKTTSGKTWLIYQTIEEVADELFIFSEEKKQGENTESAVDDTPSPAADYVDPPIQDCENLAVVESNIMFKKSYVAEKLTLIRDKMFLHIGDQKQFQLGKASDNDKEFLESSLEQLDTRLKAHYSLKGKLESEVYVRRATEITSHKKIYQRHARSTKEKMDNQTEKFNFLLEKSLQLMKAHNQQQKKVREELPAAKNLSQLQGTAGRNRENSQRFGIEIKEILNELNRLSTVEVESLIAKNQQFLKECKEMSNGGDYSKQEIEWYGQMMKEITTQLEQQKVKRTEKMNEIEAHTSKKKQQFLDAFEKDYAVCVQELAAKDCSGKKYGKPKRYAQERVRGEMAKCQQAQVNIDKLLQELAVELEKTSPEKPSSLDIRKKLMIIRSCIGRYSKHIEAIKPDSKLQEMPRVNYNEDRCDTLLAGQQQTEQDEKRKQAELERLGQLSQQKDDRKFMQQIDDVEKVMKEEAQKIYVGDKAKYLTGTDKIPDFLREYIATMKKNAETFRLNSVRQLRATCLRLLTMTDHITNRILQGLQRFYGDTRRNSTIPQYTKFQKLSEEMQKVKNENLKKLRPNLINPACAQQLTELDSAQKKRLSEFRQSIKKSRELILDGQFKTSSRFLTAVLNNFEFLIQYYDSMILEEDFIKLPGDQTKEKKHLNLKELMLLKQKGQTFDPNSERNLTKKWAGVGYNMYDCPNRKYEYVKTVVQEQKIDPKKAGKKESKDPKQPPPAEQAQAGVTKQIQSIKTDRQKGAFQQRNHVLEAFKKDFDKDLETFTRELESAEKNEQKFEQRWNQTVETFKKGK